MAGRLMKIKEEIEPAVAAGKKRLPGKRLRSFERRYRGILREAGPCYPPPPERQTGQRGRIKQPKCKNLLDRLRVYREATLAFMYDFSVPFDNNLRERDLRMLKTQQKISGCFRSPNGGRIYCRIRGYISSAKKQGHRILHAIEAVFSGQPLPLAAAL